MCLIFLTFSLYDVEEDVIWTSFSAIQGRGENYFWNWLNFGQKPLFNKKMSWFKFWSRSKSKSKDIKDEYQKELKRSESLREDSNLTEAEREKQKLKHTLSISRSGRFKHKKRERGGILDKPEMFDKTLENGNGGRPTVKPPNPPSSGHSRSPNNTCRDVRDVFQSNYPSHVAAVWNRSYAELKKTCDYYMQS